jgi:hypothetical protein
LGGVVSLVITFMIFSMPEDMAPSGLTRQTGLSESRREARTSATRSPGWT